jgi:quercetin dioxygenase-like cupin family protein
MHDQSLPPGALLIALAAASTAAEHDGPQWSHESTDLDLTLLRWQAQHQIPAHVNDEVDVLVIGVAGAGDVVVGAAVYRLASGLALLIPKGVERSLRAGDAPWSYLSVHRRRRGLWPTVRGEPRPM